MKRSFRNFVTVAGLVLVTGLQASAEDSKLGSKHLNEHTFRQALDCLVNRDNDWFAPTFVSHKVLRLKQVSWTPDPYSPDENSLFIAAYDQDQRQGELIHLLVERKQGKNVFWIVNNTQFRRRNKTYELHSPLGGLGTEARLIRELKRMESQNYVEIVRNSVHRTNTECHWYGEQSDPALQK